ncbi:MAG: hypothetical protein ACKVPX_11955 [Myxococcaceae bacterium]
MEGLAATNANPAGINAEFTSLKEDLVGTGINVSDVAADASTLRGWRGQIESRVSDLTNRGENLSKAMGDLQRVRTLALELNPIQSKLAEHEAALTTVEASRVHADEVLRTSNLKLAHARAAEAAAQR